jgi:hypothetical protein
LPHDPLANINRAALELCSVAFSLRERRQRAGWGECPFFSIRMMVEKETSSKAAQRPNDARAAFDNLFKD